MQTAFKLIYPDRCVACGALVEGAEGLCAACWADTPFITGLVCAHCGAPLPGEATAQGAAAPDLCDSCLGGARPWDRGRAVMLYAATGRRLVLALKRGDRLDLARPLGAWMTARAGEIAGREALVVPVPAHWTRLVRRRFNQAAVLAREIARRSGRPWSPDALVRARRTVPLEGLGAPERAAVLAGAIRPHPRRGAALAGREVLLVDDVLTSGATMAAAAEAARAAGAREIAVLALARVVKPA